MSTDVNVLPLEEDEETASSGRLKKVLVVVLALLGVSAAAWFLVLRPAGAEPPPTPGEVLRLDPVQVNLSGGHYLRMGLALQLTEEAHEVEGSKALDAAISLFSGKDIDELARPRDREHLLEELQVMLGERYHGDVMEVYLTEFVTQ